MSDTWTLGISCWIYASIFMEHLPADHGGGHWTFDFLSFNGLSSIILLASIKHPFVSAFLVKQ
jgi:hypothetical protein